MRGVDRGRRRLREGGQHVHQGTGASTPASLDRPRTARSASSPPTPPPSPGPTSTSAAKQPVSPNERDFVAENDFARTMGLRAVASPAARHLGHCGFRLWEGLPIPPNPRKTTAPSASSPYPSPSRSTARTSLTAASMRNRRRPGNACSSGLRRRASAPTTGQPPACPR